MNGRKLGTLALAAAVATGVGACDDGGATVVEAGTSLASLVPEGGASNVATDTDIELTFDRPMHDHASDYAALHRGDVTGPVVLGTWSLEGNGTMMRFQPDMALDPGTEYTVHLGGGMMDAGGHPVDLGTNGTHMGGEWATGSMMSGGMHGGGMGGGQHDHMGAGWDHPDNGSHGMVFTFTTAG